MTQQDELHGETKIIPVKIHNLATVSSTVKQDRTPEQPDASETGTSGNLETHAQDVL